MQETGNRLDCALHALEAIGCSIVNLLTNIQVDVALLMQVRAAAKTVQIRTLPSAAILHLARSMVCAEECEHRGQALTRALANSQRLTVLWISLLAPGRYDAIALASSSTLSTLALAEDFIDKFSLIAALADEACMCCQTSADAMRHAIAGDPLI